MNKSIHQSVVSPIIAVALLLGGGLAADAQTNSAPPLTTTNSALPTLDLPTFLDVLTNIPTTTNFLSAKIGLDTGATIKNGLENFLKVSGYFATNWVAAGEVQNAAVASVVDSGSLYAGYRVAWANADVYALGGLRKNWSGAGGHALQGGVGIGASYIPLTGGILPIVCEAFVLTSRTGGIFSTSPQLEFRVGTGFRF